MEAASLPTASATPSLGVARRRTGEQAIRIVLLLAALLFLITLILNAISIRFVRKYRQVYE